MQVATQRRLYDELNIESELEFVYKFAYRAGFDAAGSEHELCHVFLGRAPAEVFPNDLEIADIRFISTADLDREFADKPGTLTPWFALEWEALCTRFGAILSRYTVPV